VKSNAECSNSYSDISNFYIFDTHICAGDSGKDSCGGDGGGPLFTWENGRWTQIGVVSTGNGCGLPDYPGVYARVTKAKAWIQNIASGTEDSDC